MNYSFSVYFTALNEFIVQNNNLTIAKYFAQ